jgi:hypothetical protein
VKGFEPPTYGLQIRCSTVELHQPNVFNIKLNVNDYITNIYTINLEISQINFYLFWNFVNFNSLQNSNEIKFQTDSRDGIVKMLQQKDRKLKR